MPMIEDVRGGGTGKISAEGRGKLSVSEKEILAMQARNRDVSSGSHAEVEARQAAAAEDTAKKRLQRFGAPWIKNPRGQG
jgi:hypothetical protein